MQDNKCVEYKCDTTKLPKSNNYKRTDSAGNGPLNYLDEVTFGCADGFAFKGQQLQDVRRKCNLDWADEYVPQDHSNDCKVGPEPK